MGDILFLVHRLPWPPNKGDKIRSYHVLHHLARHHRVHLGTFVDDPADWPYLEQVQACCADVCARPLPRRWAQLRALSGLLSGEPLTLPWYRDRGLARWVRRVHDEVPLTAVVVFSSSMGQYLPAGDDGPVRVVDFVDIDSDKWRQYAQRRAWPMASVFAREARRLLDYERRLAAVSDASVFVSPSEAEAFRGLAPEAAAAVVPMGNGVDTGYFDPAAVGPSPYPEGQRPLVLTGAMDYWPNVDAACWFAREVLPRVRAQEPAAHFYVVGSRPAPALAALNGQPGVTVTGFVDDVRPWIGHAAVAVAPLRVARGIQNKVLEAMALARPVIASPEALEGLQVDLDAEVVRAAAEPGTMAEAVCRQLAEAGEGIGAAARQRILHDYTWERQLTRLDQLLAGGKRAGVPMEEASAVGVSHGR
ncbi:TIGR03087 family PEP-CTERM/XrtA system glycosyltransferase [Halorhodospira sp. 9621]|uniref:TIGR03087 family PEP-CTERM/XrtA system glycosyltransferase n=1 Tax=Halorhodospira sp. 9621 TaxID=2899135 RepID=UPI001EE7F244|nr:TIGR03087 family PEP-CTERM/XrtA system glycosyltransferase [Halorhodospira sp. 9621]